MNTDSMLSWFWSLGRRFLSVATRATLLGAFCAVTSQVLVAVASFLPFKALSLAIRDVSPLHLWHVEHIERRVFILVLCLLAFACYTVHLLCLRRLESCVSQGTQVLLQRTGKLVVFDKQQSIAENGYRRFSMGLASALIALMCMTVLADWNRALFWDMLAYTALLLLVALPLALRSAKARRLLDDRLERVLEAVSGLGFVSSFIYLVVEIIDNQHVLMIGVGSLIVVRQYFRNLTRLLRAGTELWRKRMQLSALFFHHQVLIPDSEANDFWGLFEPSQRQANVAEVVRHLLGSDALVMRTNWVASGAVDTVALVVEAAVGQLNHSLCLRFFSHSRSSLARHEMALLSNGMPLPPTGFLGGLVLSGGFHCHVFNVTGFRQLDGQPLLEAMTQVRRQLLCRQPPMELVSTCARSKSYLWQRLRVDMAVRLRHVLGPTCHDEQLQVFETELDGIVQLLRRLPSGIAQPGMGKGTVWGGDGSRALLCSWDYWVLESLGFGWPADTDERLDELQAAMVDAARQRKDLPGEILPIARLCALLGAFEYSYLRQDYSTAVQLLSRAMDLYPQLLAEPQAKKVGEH